MHESYVRQFHAHEDTTHEEGDGDADKRDTEQEDTVELGRGRLVGLVKQHEAHATHDEQEAGREALHYKLTIHSVLHERYL